MLKNILLVSAFVCHSVSASGKPVEGSVVEKEIKKNIVTMSVSSLEQRILQEFNKTSLRARIVKIRVKRGKKKTKVYLTWHPQEAKNLASDTFIIVGVVTKLVPKFYSISLKAIHPKYMRWSGRVFWNGVVTRSAVQINRFGEPRPQPLYRLPAASLH